jgi:AcrR family transcriptional regulator
VSAGNEALASPPELSLSARTAPTGDGGAASNRKRRDSHMTQRSRIVRVMIELSTAEGFRGVSVDRLWARAGVSPQTYYEHFADKEEVLVAAYRACAEHILVRMRSAVADGDISQLPRLALGGLLQAVADDPDAGRLLFVEALSGRARMRDERSRTFHSLECRAADFLEPTSGGSTALDIPAIAVVGALRYIVSHHLHDYAEDELPARLEDGLAWLYSYARGSGFEPWSTSYRALREDSSLTFVPRQRARPERLRPGRHGLPPGVIARSQPMRLINATAEVMMAKGYANTRVEHIVAQARVARPVFYRNFADKQTAFLEAQRFSTQSIFERCTDAYFSSQQWPARAWRTLEVLTGLMATNLAFSYLLIVECYAAGPADAQGRGNHSVVRVLPRGRLRLPPRRRFAAATVLASDRRGDPRNRSTFRRQERPRRLGCAPAPADLHRARPFYGR